MQLIIYAKHESKSLKAPKRPCCILIRPSLTSRFSSLSSSLKKWRTLNGKIPVKINSCLFQNKTLKLGSCLVNIVFKSKEKEKLTFVGQSSTLNIPMFKL